MPPFHTKQQKRAQRACTFVSELTGDNKKDYSQLAKRFPALVHTCGLAQAVSFVEAKGKEVGELYLTHLEKVMEMRDNENLGEKSRNSDLTDYQYLTREVISSSTWLKRYSEALLGDGK